MKLLAIETSGHAGSIALFDAGEFIAERALDPSRRSATTLAPTIRELLAEVGWAPRELRLIVAAVGPGSFTGLRVGVMTAKTLAYVVGGEVTAVNTLLAIAERAPTAIERVAVVLDAQRQQVFAAEFARNAQGRFEFTAETAIVDNDAWLAALRPGTAVTGPALQKLAPRLPAEVQTLAPELWEPQARAIGELGWQKYQAGERDDLWRLVPQYYRRSAAEEKLDAASPP